MECNLIVKRDTNFLIKIPNFRLISFTEQLIKNIPTNATRKLYDNTVDAMRATTNHLVNMVNEDGGWTVALYSKKGQKLDQGETLTKDKSTMVSSDEIKYHIVSITPTKHKVWTTKLLADFNFELPENDVEFESDTEDEN